MKFKPPFQKSEDNPLIIIDSLGIRVIKFRKKDKGNLGIILRLLNKHYDPSPSHRVTDLMKNNPILSFFMGSLFGGAVGPHIQIEGSNEEPTSLSEKLQEAIDIEDFEEAQIIQEMIDEPEKICMCKKCREKRESKED